MNFRNILTVILLCPLLLIGCTKSDETEETPDHDTTLEQITAAKSPFALAKTATPILKTSDWDSIFGGAEGKELKYDRFGEIDELVFLAMPKTFFHLQRQIRQKTRSGKETIYYKVTTPIYQGSEELWVDGRFLDVQDTLPSEVTPPALNAAKTLILLRKAKGKPYTWHGSNPEGVPELLNYYPPVGDISQRTESDWILKGFDTLGLLYYASEGLTPLDPTALATFGEPVFVDLSTATPSPATSEAPGGDFRDDPLLAQTKLLMGALHPLDVISLNERTWIVLDGEEVVEARYRSAYDGSVQITSLLDTVHGLLSKGTLVKNPFQEFEDQDIKKLFIRRFQAPSTEEEKTDEVPEEPASTTVKDGE